ncbi:hypothetical protein [Deinococcus pimensis]|uniref:hypothetical protein n=1 Tax=Deinococcus pimensis TaxID=309888 RepID=UPI0004827768|nr:hypothetical protein [Deinococcus pimensis]
MIRETHITGSAPPRPSHPSPRVQQIADTLRGGATPTCSPEELTAALRYINDKARHDAQQRGSITNRHGTRPQATTTHDPDVDRPLSRVDALRTLGLYRQGVRAQPVSRGYTPPRLRAPHVFRHHEDQTLTRLSRKVSREWTGLLTATSSASLKGGRLTSAEGRNFIRIVEALRQHCYLRVDHHGRPIEAREQVVLTVGGARHCFARECGMSVSTFYRALHHPLAHLFVRTQKVQYQERHTLARRNGATLFTVALYEPALPVRLEDEYYREPIDTGGVLVVPDDTSQDERTELRPSTTREQQEQGRNCGQLTAAMRHAWVTDGTVRTWLDSAALASKREGGQVRTTDTLHGCVERLRTHDPHLWELATQIAVHHDTEHHAVAAVGYYKALVHLGVPVVRQCVQKIQRWQHQGQQIRSPGALLMHHLNRAARARTGFNIRDLGAASHSPVNAAPTTKA